MYSKYLTIKNTNASATVAPMYRRYFPKSFILSDAQDITIVTDDPMRTMVLSVASGTLRIVAPSGHSVAPVRRMMYDEKSAPNSMTSEARNSQIPSLTLFSPVSARGSTV